MSSVGLVSRNPARLIPTFKQTERKLLSVFLAVLNHCPILRGQLLQEVGFNSGRTAVYQGTMEPSFTDPKAPPGRPDGYITCERGKTAWSALIEAKSENNQVAPEQIQQYIDLAKHLNVDCVISISNQFSAASPELPYTIAANRFKGRKVFHWSWPHIANQMTLFLSGDECPESESAIISEALAFFSEPTCGIQTFDQMPTSWPDFVQAANTTIGFNMSTPGLAEIIHAWHQERRDLAIKLDRVATSGAKQNFSRKQKSSEVERIKNDRTQLANEYTLQASYQFNRGGPELELTADLKACSQRLQMFIPVPEKMKARATASWLQKLLSGCSKEFQQVHCVWPGHQPDTLHDVSELIANPSLISDGHKDAPKQVSLVNTLQDVRRFKSRKRFIEDLEKAALSMTNAIQKLGFLSL